MKYQSANSCKLYVSSDTRFDNLLRFSLPFFITLLLISFSPAFSIDYDDSRFCPLSEIHPNMKARGLTVISGVSIESFDVHILGVLSNSKLSEALVISGNSILVRVEGEVIKKAGGIAAGMSGSPVYIGDRLVGGLSSGWVMSDHTIGLVTPIADMLAIMRFGKIPNDYIEKKQGGLNKTGSKAPDKTEPKKTLAPEKSPSHPELRPAPVKQKEPASKSAIRTGLMNIDSLPLPGVYRPLNGQNIKINSSEIMEKLLVPSADESTYQMLSSASFDKENTEKTLLFRRVASPLFVSGLSKRAADVLQKNPRLKNLAIMPSSAGTAITVDPVLQPGSSVAVQLARGDVNITSLGTLTYVEDKQFIALSHSFLKKGRVDYFFSSAYIYHCFSSLDMPFKIGAPIKIKGRVTQDREQCITGYLDHAPKHIPLSIEARDMDTGAFRNMSVQIINDHDLLSSILLTVLTQSGESAINRVGAGTGRISFTIIGKTTDGAHRINRSETVYSEDDIITKGAESFISILDRLVKNEFSLFEIKELFYSIEVTNQKEVSAIKRIEAPEKTIIPGRDLLVKVYIKPFRKPVNVFTKRLFIPLDFKPGEYVLTAVGGSSDSADTDVSAGNSSFLSGDKEDEIQ